MSSTVRLLVNASLLFCFSAEVSTRSFWLEVFWWHWLCGGRKADLLAGSAKDSRLRRCLSPVTILSTSTVSLAAGRSSSSPEAAARTLLVLPTHLPSPIFSAGADFDAGELLSLGYDRVAADQSLGMLFISLLFRSDVPPVLFLLPRFHTALLHFLALSIISTHCLSRSIAGSFAKESQSPGAVAGTYLRLLQAIVRRYSEARYRNRGHTNTATALGAMC